MADFVMGKFSAGSLGGCALHGVTASRVVGVGVRGRQGDEARRHAVTPASSRAAGTSPPTSESGLLWDCVSWLDVLRRGGRGTGRRRWWSVRRSTSTADSRYTASPAQRSGCSSASRSRYRSRSWARPHHLVGAQADALAARRSRAAALAVMVSRRPPTVERSASAGAPLRRTGFARPRGRERRGVGLALGRASAAPPVILELSIDLPGVADGRTRGEEAAHRPVHGRKRFGQGRGPLTASTSPGRYRAAWAGWVRARAARSARGSRRSSASSGTTPAAPGVGDAAARRAKASRSATSSASADGAGELLRPMGAAEAARLGVELHGTLTTSVFATRSSSSSRRAVTPSSPNTSRSAVTALAARWKAGAERRWSVRGVGVRHPSAGQRRQPGLPARGR